MRRDLRSDLSRPRLRFVCGERVEFILSTGRPRYGTVVGYVIDEDEQTSLKIRDSSGFIHPAVQPKDTTSMPLTPQRVHDADG